MQREIQFVSSAGKLRSVIYKNQAKQSLFYCYRLIIQTENCLSSLSSSPFQSQSYSVMTLRKSFIKEEIIHNYIVATEVVSHYDTKRCYCHALLLLRD